MDKNKTRQMDHDDNDGNKDTLTTSQGEFERAEVTDTLREGRGVTRCLDGMVSRVEVRQAERHEDVRGKNSEVGEGGESVDEQITSELKTEHEDAKVQLEDKEMERTKEGDGKTGEHAEDEQGSRTGERNEETTEGNGSREGDGNCKEDKIVCFLNKLPLFAAALPLIFRF